MITVDTGEPMADSLPEARRLKKSYRVVLQNDPCAYCGWKPDSDLERRKMKVMTIDHIIPKSKMEHKKNRRPKYHEERGWENWTGSCYNCNHAKKDTPLLEFLLEGTRPRPVVFGTSRSRRKRAPKWHTNTS